MEAGHKKNVFGNYCVCVCVTNGGEVRGLGVGGNGKWRKKMSKMLTLCRKLRSIKFGEVKLSLLEM